MQSLFFCVFFFFQVVTKGKGQKCRNLCSLWLNFHIFLKLVCINFWHIVYIFDAYVYDKSKKYDVVAAGLRTSVF